MIRDRVRELALTGVVLLSGTALFALTTDITGPVVSVLDGNTIDVLHNGQAQCIRLNGIDCPALRVNYYERPAVLLIPRGEGEAELCPNEQVVE